MESCKILVSAYDWIQKRMDAGDCSDAKSELHDYLSRCYGDLLCSIYGDLSSDFISLVFWLV